MKNKYRLYRIDHIKGMMMYYYISECLTFNIIEAEDNFENSSQLQGYDEYVITISKN